LQACPSACGRVVSFLVSRQEKKNKIFKKTHNLGKSLAVYFSFFLIKKKEKIKAL
jgi:hypothetical protein